MLEDIEKTFDTAFFNADHNLKLIGQILATLDDLVLAEDLNATFLVQSIGSVTGQLSTMAFCFAQLMCKTLLYSENYFILKEKFQQLKIENFHLKSDKSLMSFVRKLGRISSLDYQSQKSSANSPSPKPAHPRSSPLLSNQTSSVKHQENRKNPKSKKKKKKKTLKNNKNKGGSLNGGETILNGSSRFSTRLDHSLQKEILDCQDAMSDGETLDTLEQCFLNNLNRDCLEGNATFRMHRWNNNAFRLIYRNFKEVELIHSLRAENLSLQKELLIAKCGLTQHRLVTRYLNNQLSGRIQQIQLLARYCPISSFASSNSSISSLSSSSSSSLSSSSSSSSRRDKRDSNFEQIWNDLESEILLNKFKTTVQAINQSSASTACSSTLFDLLHHSDSSIGSVPDHSQSQSRSSLKSSIKSSVSRINDRNRIPAPASLDNDSVQSHDQREPPESTTVTELNSDPSQLKMWKNFRSNWFNFGLFRFVFVQLYSDSKLGISIIGGKEYSHPIMISEIFAGSPAADCGAFRPGDIILSVNFSDMTDVCHDEAVHLLQNLCGNCRFGVIYFKPEVDLDEPSRNSFSSSVSSSSQIPTKSSAPPPPSPGVVTSNSSIVSNLLSAFSPASKSVRSTSTSLQFPPMPAPVTQSPAILSPSTLSLLEISHLCRNYYRSVFNSFLTLPFSFIPYSNSSSSQSGGSNTAESSTSSTTTTTTTSSSSTDSESETENVDSSTQLSATNHKSEICQKTTKVDCQSGSSGKISLSIKKSFPGTATRFGTLFSNGS